MERTDTDTSRFMAQSLLSHAREICRYAKTFCGPSVANLALDEGKREKFAGTVERMINEMHGLLQMAKYKGISPLCNLEQIEAYMDEARIAIARPAPGARQSAPQFN